jgi:predicted nuclease of predicted toxin-antitoxin system
MRILLDECLPAGLRRDLPGHDVATVQAMNWAGTQNGALLRLAADAGFDAFITVDGSIEFQHRIQNLPFGIIALRARSNDIRDLRPLMLAVRANLPSLKAGSLVRLP